MSRPKTEGGWCLAAVCLAACFWAATEGMLYLDIGFAAKITITKAQYLGIATVTPFALLFGVTVFGAPGWPIRKGRYVLVGMMVAILAMVWTNPYHHLFFERYLPTAAGPVQMVALAHGPLWWAVLVYHYGLLALLSYVLIARQFGADPIRRAQSRTVLAAVIAVWVANIVYVTGNSPVENMDISPIAFTFVAGAMAWGFYRYDLLERLPAAKAAVFNGIADAIVVFDEAHRVVDYNPAAATLFSFSGPKGKLAQSQGLFQQHPALVRMLEDTENGEVAVSGAAQPTWYDVRVSPLTGGGGVPLGKVMALRDISGRKRMEEDLRESEGRYRQIFEVAPAGIYELDYRTGRIVDANDAICEYSGYAREELLSIDPSSLLTEESQRRFLDRLEKITRGEAVPATVEFTVIRKDGSEIDMGVNVRFIEDDGDIVGASVIAQDISERKQEARAAAQTKERIETILDTIHSGIFVIDCETRRIIDTNRAAAEMVGLAKEEIQGASCHGFVCHRSDGCCPILDEGQSVQNMETSLVRGDGSTLKILKTVNDVILDGRRCLIESFIDISARVDAEAAAKAHQDRFKTFFSNINDAIFVHPFKDEGFGRFIEVNDIACSRYGYTRDELLQLSPREITVKADADAHGAQETRRRLIASRHLIFESTHIKKSGETFPVEINTNIVEQFGKPVILAVVRDISARKKAEAERAHIESQYRQAQKVEAIGRLAGGVAHDLNNILSPIIGYGELLCIDLDAGDARHRLADQIVQAGYRARDLVHQLLAFGRKQTLSYQNADLNDVLKNFEDLLRRTIRENIEIVISPSPSLRPIRADVGQIEQVIMNLAVNAQDAMATGGVLTLETRMSMPEDDGCPSDAPCVLLSISDTGCGMDASLQEHIFEPFFTTKGEKGTGLGLATVYGIVKQHGGGIRVASRPDHGTTFTIHLPAADGPGAPATVAAAPGRTTGSETILLVEDSAPVRQMSHEVLARCGYRLMVAESGSGAMALLEAAAAPVDLLLTDVVMPDMNGKELYAAVLERCPGVSVLYMSGYTDDVIADHGVLEEGTAFIQKPFRIQELTAAVRSLLDARRRGGGPRHATGLTDAFQGPP